MGDIAPDYAPGSHTASLGLAFYDAMLLPPQFHDGAFIDKQGAVLLADDVGNRIWRVTPDASH